MPNINGIQLAKQLKECLPGLKVLYMSGYTDNVIEQHGKIDTKASFISKPFNKYQIAVKVKEVLTAK